MSPIKGQLKHNYCKLSNHVIFTTASLYALHRPYRCHRRIGDIHAEDQWLAKALAYLSNQRVEQILATGDIADGIGDLARCCQLLTAFNVVTVAGNHDRWLLKGELRHLPNAIDPATFCPTICRFLAAQSVLL